jgi:hypothetical protein
MELMTSAEIRAIRERAGKATHGPWHGGCLGSRGKCQCRYIFDEGHAGAVGEVYVDNGKSISDGGNDCPSRKEAIANLLFIVHSRTDVPALCDAVEEARKALREIAEMDIIRFMDPQVSPENAVRVMVNFMRRIARRALGEE